MHIPGYQPICSNQDDLGIFSQFKDTPGGILGFLFTMQLGHSVDGIISLEKNLKFLQSGTLTDIGLGTISV